jgi:pantoate--beta-alanine ligase
LDGRLCTGFSHCLACQVVRHSLTNNPLTVLTLFVNPTQFAPHEDLASYPRTLNSDVQKLEGLLHRLQDTARSDGGHTLAAFDTPSSESPLIVFAPSREVMYPLSLLKDPEAGGELGERMLQDTSKQRGAFVEVKGWGNVMEGKSRRKCCGQEKWRRYSPYVIWPQLNSFKV